MLYLHLFAWPNTLCDRSDSSSHHREETSGPVSNSILYDNTLTLTIIIIPTIIGFYFRSTFVVPVLVTLLVTLTSPVVPSDLYNYLVS